MTRFDVFYQALLSRDARFDGRFFVGVKTTGIYCRPICPAKPKRENVDFFSSSAAAERKGYRPCLRCRPESAPQSPAWSGTSAVVQRALKLIASGEFDERGEEKFAERLGVSGRHLRRLFDEHVGRSPKQVADAQRLGFARKLVVETALPLTAVCEAAGFESLRRFNSAFKDRFQRPPSALRKSKKRLSDFGTVELALSYRPPFDFESVLQFHRRHALQGLEVVTTDCYSRVASLRGELVAFEVRDVPDRNALSLKILAAPTHVLFDVVQTVRAMFDLDADPLIVRQALERVPRLKKLVSKRPGTRIARGFDPFETAIATILGQLVSTQMAGRLVADLIREYGAAALHPVTGEELLLFPSRDVLATSNLEKLKTTGGRRVAIRSLAEAVIRGRVPLEEPSDIEHLKKRLLEIPGIGPWSAEYIALRATGDSDSFPRSDLVLKRATSGARAIDLDLIRPWRSYAAVHLWNEPREES